MRKDLQKIHDSLKEGARQVANRQFDDPENRIGIRHLANENIDLPLFMVMDVLYQPASMQGGIS